jgi:addiction module HigA family antidote
VSQGFAAPRAPTPVGHRQPVADRRATGRARSDVAPLPGISRQHLYDIPRERKPVTPKVAMRLGKLFGDGPGAWVRMQAAHDTWHAAREVDTSRIPTLDAA